MFTIITKIKKRDGREVVFDSEKIRSAIKKAFLASNILDEKIFDSLTEQSLKILESKYENTIPTVENVQDIVENIIILNNYASVAKSYILYREKHKEIRAKKILEEIKEKKLNIKKQDGSLELFDQSKINKKIENISSGLSGIDFDAIAKEVSKTIYNEVPIKEIKKSVLNAVKLKIEKHYNYSYLASRLLLDQLYQDIIGKEFSDDSLTISYKEKFKEYIKKGIVEDVLNKELAEFDLDKLSIAINPKRDEKFMYLGLQTLYDRYLLRTRKKDVFELPQYLWMRVAMGIALKENDKEKYAIEFYNTLSQMHVVSSTPTLFNSGTTHSQMSSCYVNTAEDSIIGIFKTYSDCARLSKWAGGIGTDWTKVRAKGAKIYATNGESQGLIPFIKIYNDVALAVNQGGKRRGAMAAYLEVWHKDIEEFIELKKNTGDERRRAHDIHTAVMIPDLFMKRVKEKGKWTLFSPDIAPELYSSYGKIFDEAYLKYEKENLPGSKEVNALDLWKKLLTMVYETGHPWLTWKDPINIRNNQSHKGMVHSSNLCTEITINTSEKETAVCNLASLNLSKMVHDGKIDDELLSKTVTTAIRMLDNVIDVNFYPIVEAKNSNMENRPIGLGVMGYQDTLYQLKIDFDSEENIAFADESMEKISYHAILASSKLAKEKGSYNSYSGSKWSNGILPYDSLKQLEDERQIELKVSKNKKLDWNIIKDHIKEHGMRNSNCMAIAPTATIANIAGTTPCVEPTYKNIYMKENLSGNFVVVNKHLVDELSSIDLWNDKILTKIKLNNGSVLDIDEIPADIRRRYKESFEIDSKWIIMAAAARGKWIDQSASTNIFIKTTSGKAISDLYMFAWETGLKTTYYLRSLAASQVTKTIAVEEEKPKVKLCSIENPDCESCQ